MHRILSITERLSSKVYIAKQVMNLVFLATLLVATLLVGKLIGSRPAALAAAVFAVSSEYLLFYKDMVHFDQPALLGMMILVYTLALYRLDGRRRAPYLGTVLAISMGRGYASFAVLIVWFLIEAVLSLRTAKGGWRENAKALIRLPATRACVLGFALGTLLLAYNVGVEARRTGVPVVQTSILQSAEGRLGLDQAVNAAYAEVTSWGGFLQDQLDRLVRWSVPLRKPGGGTGPNLLIFGTALAVIGIQMMRWDRDRRVVALLMVLPGFVWMLGLRNMSGPHDYTSMYYLGVPLTFYAAVFAVLRIASRPPLAWGVLAVALSLFVAANQRTQTLHLALEVRSDPTARLSQYTWDMMRIAEELPESGLVISMEQGVDNAPYGFGFYLPGHFLGPVEQADFVISRNASYLPGNLTPENEHLFLFPSRPGP